jgi:L-fucose mutarotase/ribose pyranase (RbsD/FucU family)
MGAATANWRGELERALPLFGHRNWIVIVDSAYPLQNATGIQVVATSADHLEVLQSVLKAVRAAKHVRAQIYLDAELPFVPENYAAGIETYRAGLATALQGEKPVSIPHEQIIQRLQKAGGEFRVLVLKSNLALPYTSVFLELGCGYWTDQAESELRRTMGEAH